MYSNSEFKLLDIGCGANPRGDVNVYFFNSGYNPQTGDQINGDYIDPKKIPNFIVADAAYLPFRDGTFDTVFSSHTIEHILDPFQFFKEACRIAKRKVIFRCPHRLGSGAKMPHHLNYFDEKWFKHSSKKIGLDSQQFVNIYDYPISNKLKKIFPSTLYSSFPCRALRYIERRRLNAKLRIAPFELEVWVKKVHCKSKNVKTKFVVVYNSPRKYFSGFASSTIINSQNVISLFNSSREPLPKIFNSIIEKHLKENVWFVFCSQDLIIKEDLQDKLRNKDVCAIYGPIGMRLALDQPLGSIKLNNQMSIGQHITEEIPIQTLDEICLIAHSEFFRQDIRFDEQFPFHFYGSDLCMQAYRIGFDVLAIPMNCQLNRNKFYQNKLTSEYFCSLNNFREKWKNFLPIKTLSTLIV